MLPEAMTPQAEATLSETVAKSPEVHQRTEIMQINGRYCRDNKKIAVFQIKGATRKLNLFNSIFSSQEYRVFPKSCDALAKVGRKGKVRHLF
jgi:hypothetical protein